jgi:hypothetical protein
MGVREIGPLAVAEARPGPPVSRDFEVARSIGADACLFHDSRPFGDFRLDEVRELFKTRRGDFYALICRPLLGIRLGDRKFNRMSLSIAQFCGC